ncbi:V-type ATP synthase subunit K [bacterium]|nr:V-type ATP synthase subunit K [bacterium]
MTNLGDMSLCLALGAVGSCLGIGAAGQAAVGAWKKAYALNKAAPFALVAFVGAPLSQTIYSMILRDAIKNAAWAPGTTHWQIMLGGVAGVGIMLSAWFQGKIGAKAADALGETGKGFGNYLMAIGIIETVALFVMVFAMNGLPKG